MPDGLTRRINGFARQDPMANRRRGPTGDCEEITKSLKKTPFFDGASDLRVWSFVS